MRGEEYWADGVGEDGDLGMSSHYSDISRLGDTLDKAEQVAATQTATGGGEKIGMG